MWSLRIPFWKTNYQKILICNAFYVVQFQFQHIHTIHRLNLAIILSTSLFCFVFKAYQPLSSGALHSIKFCIVKSRCPAVLGNNSPCYFYLADFYTCSPTSLYVLSSPSQQLLIITILSSCWHFKDITRFIGGNNVLWGPKWTSDETL